MIFLSFVHFLPQSHTRIHTVKGETEGQNRDMAKYALPLPIKKTQMIRVERYRDSDLVNSGKRLYTVKIYSLSSHLQLVFMALGTNLMQTRYGYLISWFLIYGCALKKCT